MSPEELEKARCLMESHEALKKQTGRALLAHIDEQAKQIATLKAALITEKAMSLHWYQTAKEGETRDWEEYSGEEQESRLWYAEHRLAREMPEIFGKEGI